MNSVISPKLIVDNRGVIRSKFAAKCVRMDVEHLNDLCRAPLLSREEELLLGRKAFGGCKLSQDKLVEHNIRLVKKMVEKFVTPLATMGHLMSVGLEGLVKASRAYDPEKYQTRFSTLACRCILNSIYHELDTLKRKTKHLKTNALDKMGGGLYSEVEPVDYRETYQMDPERKEKIEIVQKAIEKLLPRDQYFLKAYYGIAPYKSPLTFKELGKIEGITRQRVEQIISRAKARLRAVCDTTDWGM